MHMRLAGLVLQQDLKIAHYLMRDVKDCLKLARELTRKMHLGALSILKLHGTLCWSARPKTTCAISNVRVHIQLLVSGPGA